MFDKQKAAGVAQSVVDHLLLTEHVKALQEGLATLGKGIESLGERIRDMERDLAVLRAETRYEAVKEAQSVVMSVQGGLNQRMEEMAVKIAQLQAAQATIESSGGAVLRLARSEDGP